MDNGRVAVPLASAGPPPFVPGFAVGAWVGFPRRLSDRQALTGRQAPCDRAEGQKSSVTDSAR